MDSLFTPFRTTIIELFLYSHSFYNHVYVFCTVGHADSLPNPPHKTMTRVGLKLSIILVGQFGWIPLVVFYSCASALACAGLCWKRTCDLDLPVEL